MVNRSFERKQEILNILTDEDQAKKLLQVWRNSNIVTFEEYNEFLSDINKKFKTEKEINL